MRLALPVEIALRACRIALKRPRISRREKNMLLAKINDLLQPEWAQMLDNQRKAAGEKE